MINHDIEKFIDHEVRLRMLEKANATLINLSRWILITSIGAVIIPVALHYFRLI